MRINCLATMTLAMMGLLGCGGGNSTESGPGSPDSGRADTFVQHEDFELAGPWSYLGPWDGEHSLTFDNKSVQYTGINADWASSWTLKSYDNKLHHFQIVFDSGNGTYYPAGKEFSGTYTSNGFILSVQLAQGLGSFPELKNPDTCVDDDSKLIPDCRRYMKQQ